MPPRRGRMPNGPGLVRGLSGAKPRTIADRRSRRLWTAGPCCLSPAVLAGDTRAQTNTGRASFGKEARPAANSRIVPAVAVAGTAGCRMPSPLGPGGRGGDSRVSIRSSRSSGQARRRTAGCQQVAGRGRSDSVAAVADRGTAGRSDAARLAAGVDRSTAARLAAAVAAATAAEAAAPLLEQAREEPAALLAEAAAVAAAAVAAVVDSRSAAGGSSVTARRSGRGAAARGSRTGGRGAAARLGHAATARSGRGAAGRSGGAASGRRGAAGRLRAARGSRGAAGRLRSAAARGTVVVLTQAGRSQGGARTEGDRGRQGGPLHGFTPAVRKDRESKSGTTLFPRRSLDASRLPSGLRPLPRDRVGPRMISS